MSRMRQVEGEKSIPILIMATTITTISTSSRKKVFHLLITDVGQGLSLVATVGSDPQTHATERLEERPTWSLVRLA